MDVANLWMQQAMQRPPIDDHAPTHPSANGDVNQWINPLPCAPELLSNRRRIDISVKTNGHLKATMQRGHQRHMLPAGFRRGGDIAKGAALTIKIHRTKRTDANRLDRAEFPARGSDPLHDIAQRSVGLTCVDPMDCSNVVRSRADSDHELGATRFDGCDEGSVSVHAAATLESRRPSAA